MGRGRQGGFNWSSQHLRAEELRWFRLSGGAQIGRGGRRCVRPVGRQLDGVRSAGNCGHTAGTGRPRRAARPPARPPHRRLPRRPGEREQAADDRGYVALLRLYLARAGYTSGPLFRASINGRGGPLSYDASHNRWKKYCAAAGAGIGIHQLRHAHATELINSGVSIEVVRCRLGLASTETTQAYTLLADKVADTEIRAARRKRDHRR